MFAVPWMTWKLDIEIVRHVVEPEALVHAVDLEPDGEIGRLEADGRQAVPSGAGEVVEIAERQRQAAAQRKLRLGNRRSGSHRRHQNRAHHHTPESTHTLSCRMVRRAVDPALRRETSRARHGDG